MAQSRLERIGTIFSRVTGLLRAEAMKPEDKPIWYDLYEAFPPKVEPRFDRSAPSNVEIRNIFYEEDIARAKFHKSLKQQEMINLFDKKRETQTQQFIKIYRDLKSQGPLDDEKIFETSIEVLQQQRQQRKFDKQLDLDSDETVELKLGLTANFIAAEEARSPKTAMNLDSTSDRESSKNSIAGIDIKTLFKD